jgi:copper resistance protein D
LPKKSRFRQAPAFLASAVSERKFGVRIFMVGSFRALLTSTYGQVLVCKLILFAAMIGFGAWNLFLLKPRIAIDIPTVNIPEQKSAVRLLLRNVLWEIGLGTLVILIVGLLGITPPPMR